MHLVNHINRFNRSKFILCIFVTSFFSSFVFSGNDGVLNFSTIVTKGSCEFNNDSVVNKDIHFNRLFTTGDMNQLDIGTPAATEKFKLSVECIGYEENEAKPVGVIVMAGTQTQYDNRIFYHQNDTTQTGFTLKVCQKNELKCEDIQQNVPYKFTNTSNELIDVEFIVSFVKRKNNVRAGNSQAAIIIEYVQD